MLNYIKWLQGMLISDTIGNLVWMSLGTFSLVSKNAIGIDNIPIFEVIVFISGLLGIKYAFKSGLKLRNIILATLLAETIFLLSIYTSLLLDPSMKTSGMLIYMIIIFGAFAKRIKREVKRSFEDTVIVTYSGKQTLKLIRKKYEIYTTVGAAIGTVLALVCLTYFKISLTTFAEVMLVLTIVQNSQDYFLWHKYLK